MVNTALLVPKIQEYIIQNLKTNAAELVLKGRLFPGVDNKAIAEQLQAKQKAEKKLPTWFASQQVLYSPLLNLSQASSEITAKYKSQLVSGEVLIDITGGFGVDDFYFSKTMNRVVHCELNSELSALAKHNFNVLSSPKNCKFIKSDGLSYLKQLSSSANWIYADPGRRSTTGQKVFRLEDCQPDILSHLDELLSKTDKILLKTSPLFDLKQGLYQLKTTREIHVVAVKNEVKELLWVIGHSPCQDIPVKTINFTTDEQQVFTNTLPHEETAKLNYSPPLSYLYEPNAAILKAGFFKTIAQDYGVFKLASNTHLYTSEKPVDFPGRRFKIIKIVAPHKKAFKKTGLKKAHVTTRNFPMTVPQIRQKFNLKDGGDEYLFFTQDNQEKKIIIWGQKS